MPKSKGPGLTEFEQEQREQAALQHGAYAFQHRGEAALDQPQRSRLAELREGVQTRAGVLDLMQERAANAVMVVEIITSYVSDQVEGGKSLDKIPALRALPAFMNTCQRALKDLLAAMPDDTEVLDLDEHVRRIMGEDSDNGHHS